MQVLDSLQQSPFAVLTLIAAPAVLTNACSVLALGTSDRFARAVDRQRELCRLLDSGVPMHAPGEGALRIRQLHRTEARAQLLLKGLTSFYISLGAFAAASLASLVGAILNLQVALLAGIAGAVAILIGLAGVGGLVYGATLLVRETRMALAGLKEESAFTHDRYADRNPREASIGDRKLPETM